MTGSDTCVQNGNNETGTGGCKISGGWRYIYQEGIVIFVEPHNEDAFKKFNEYRGDLYDEVSEGDLENCIKDDDMLSATTLSGKSLIVRIIKQSVIE